MHLVPSSMLLRPIYIKSKSNSDIKDESSLSPSGPEAACGTETSCCNEIQELAIRDSIMHKERRPGVSLTVSQNQSKESNNEQNRNGLFQKTNEETYQKKDTSRSCKQKLVDFSLFKNPFFYIFTWSFLLSQLAYFIPTFHLVARAKTLGIKIMDASYLVSVAGKKAYFCLTLKRKNIFYKNWLHFKLKKNNIFKKEFWEGQESKSFEADGSSKLSCPQICHCILHTGSPYKTVDPKPSFIFIGQ